jgi:hypothetical protein
VGFESRLGAVICGVELDAVIYGIELSARLSAMLNRATKFDAVTSNLDAVNHGVDPGSKIEFTSPRSEFSSKKEPNCKKKKKPAGSTSGQARDTGSSAQVW